MKTRKIVLVITVILFFASLFIGFSERFRQTLGNLFPALDKGELITLLIIGFFGFLLLSQFYMLDEKRKQLLLSPFGKASLGYAFNALNILGFETYRKNGLDDIMRQYLTEKFKKELEDVEMLDLERLYYDFFGRYELDINREYSEIKNIFHQAVTEKVHYLLINSPSGFKNWVKVLVKGRDFEGGKYLNTYYYNFNKLMFSIIPAFKENGDYPHQFCNKMAEAFDAIGVPEEVRNKVYSTLRYYFSTYSVAPKIYLPDLPKREEVIS